MVLQIQLGFESPVIAASLTLFSVHSTGTISPLHRPAVCCGLFRHPCRRNLRHTGGYPAGTERGARGEALFQHGESGSHDAEGSEVQPVLSGHLYGWQERHGVCLGAAVLGREGGSLFYHHRSNAYLKAGYQATPFNISLNQCGGRSWPRPRRRIYASGKYPGH